MTVRRIRRFDRHAALLVLASALLVVAHDARADDELDSPTLRKIRDTHTLVLGVRTGSVPFSYDDGTHRVVGYSRAFSERIIDAVRGALRLPQLDVREVPLTTQDRLLQIGNGSVDLECGSTTHTRERENIVGFSNGIFQLSVRMLTRKGSPVADFPDLATRPVVIIAGTPEERKLRAWNLTNGMRMQIVSVDNPAAALDVVRARRAVAFVTDEPLLYGARASAPDGGDYVIVGTPLFSEVYGCMFRRGDAEFKRIVDDTIAQMERSGEAEALFRRWFQRPIPPRGITLGYPMTDGLAALFAHPNDRPLN